MEATYPPGANTSRDASILDPIARADAFAVLAPVLEKLVCEVNADARLSIDARRVLRAVARTKTGNSLALADLAARSSTPKTRIPAALDELEICGHLTRLARAAPHLTAALPARTHPEPPEAARTEPHNQGDS